MWRLAVLAQLATAALSLGLVLSGAALLSRWEQAVFLGVFIIEVVFSSALRAAHERQQVAVRRIMDHLGLPDHPRGRP